MIEDSVFNFLSLVKPGIFDEEYENHFLRKRDEAELIHVFKEIKFLVFESDTLCAKQEIVINNRAYEISDFQRKIELVLVYYILF